MFGSGRSVASLASNVSHALCLPISLQEVLDSNITDSNAEVKAYTLYVHRPQLVGGGGGGWCVVCSSLTLQATMRYFLVDCRPVDHFSCGHLAKSFHLDANLVQHSPSALSFQLICFLSLKHVCSCCTLPLTLRWQWSVCVRGWGRWGQTLESTSASWARAGSRRTSTSTWWWPNSSRNMYAM